MKLNDEVSFSRDGLTAKGTVIRVHDKDDEYEAMVTITKVIGRDNTWACIGDSWGIDTIDLLAPVDALTKEERHHVEVMRGYARAEELIAIIDRLAPKPDGV